MDRITRKDIEQMRRDEAIQSLTEIALELHKALHAVVRRPMGVVPDSAVQFYYPDDYIGEDL